MNKKDELKVLRKFCRDLDMPKCERVYKRVKTRRGAIVGTKLDGTPIRHATAFQARLSPMCQRAFYRGAKRQLLASL